VTDAFDRMTDEFRRLDDELAAGVAPPAVDTVIRRTGALNRASVAAAAAVLTIGALVVSSAAPPSPSPSPSPTAPPTAPPGDSEEPGDGDPDGEPGTGDPDGDPDGGPGEGDPDGGDPDGEPGDGDPDGDPGGADPDVENFRVAPTGLDPDRLNPSDSGEGSPVRDLSRLLGGLL
jgi:hypothetical protein